MAGNESERILYGNELRKALERNELSLCFQPQVDIEHNRPHEIEALLLIGQSNQVLPEDARRFFGILRNFGAYAEIAE